ncbi:PDDEXK nuclease domain-containing protein [Parapedobacter tibetensis]|uniref:PDDEXK nuclease domain-containing protein n=1 Tax=Parapedobacter tibetensis TaxID=2972951 RepID=UPI00214D7208|nr:PDDEXK nuclease domain-containing protein [Parapedobacter tibetensis]
MEKTDVGVQKDTSIIIKGVKRLIETARSRVSVYINSETTILYWGIGDFINRELIEKDRAEYGRQILATVSQELTSAYGKGYTYTALSRMRKVASVFPRDIIATLSQQLSWSHFIELSTLENEPKRMYYAAFAASERWGVRKLRDNIDAMVFERTAIASHAEDNITNAIAFLRSKQSIDPELVFKNTYVLDFLNLPANYSEKELEQALIDNLQEFIMELGNGFAFVERQKRITVDTTDYHLDLLFFHRKLRRMVAIDLKLGKFKPEYKAQMELYLRWLQKNEMQNGEQSPIGLLLCSEGNTEHIELLMLNEKEIRVAQYLTELPSKEWFAEKLHRSIEMAKQRITEDLDGEVDLDK